MGVKQLLLMIAVVMGQSVLAADKKPLITNPIVEKAIREELKKPGTFDVYPLLALTKMDLEKVMELRLENNPELDLSKDISEAQDLSRQNPMEIERLRPC